MNDTFCGLPVSELFSLSDYFSESQKFSTNFFSESHKFTKSDLFSESQDSR